VPLLAVRQRCDRRIGDGSQAHAFEQIFGGSVAP
jgi:hypothetical protein